MSNIWLLTILCFVAMAGGVANACDVTPINDDNVLVGDRMYSISDNSFLEASSYINHSLSVLNKDGKETHRLSPLLLTTQRGKVIVEYKIEDLTLKSITSVTVSKSGGTRCTWKEGKATVENHLPKELWSGDVEVLALTYDKASNKIILEVKETCDRGDYSIVFLDTKKENSKNQLYFKVVRTPIAPGICKPDFSETVRIVAGLPIEALKTKTTMTIIGAAGTSASTFID